MTCETWMFLPPEAARGVALDLPVRLIRPEGEASLSFEAALPELTDQAGQVQTHNLRLAAVP